MKSLDLDSAQNFTCRSCSRCCRRPWEIAVTVGEAVAYREAGAARWFRETAAGPEGTPHDPFAPLPGALPFRIRKRAGDGACGFLSPAGRCRLHEELGESRKPLTCRLFPYQFHARENGPLLTTSFSCPTVARNEGTPTRTRLRDIERLQRAWLKEHTPGEARLELVAGRPLSPHALLTLRNVLQEILDRPSPSGRSDLRANVDRAARVLEDLARYRVVRLAPEAFAEYLDLTGRHAARSPKPLPPRPPTALGRLLARGFLFLVLAARLQGQEPGRGLRLGLRVRLLRLLAHLHGLGRGVSGIDRRALQDVRVDLAQPALHALVHHFLRAHVATLGTGRRPVLDEICFGLALLNAGLRLGALAAHARGSSAVDEADLVAGLAEAADLEHAPSRGVLGGLLNVLAGGVEPAYQFAAATETPA